MRKSLRFTVLCFGVAAVVMCIGIGSSFAWNSGADRAWWHGLSQASRNMFILNRAAQDAGKADVGLNCKQWAQKVVSDASRGVVTLPPTSDGGYGCSWDDSLAVVGSCFPVEYFQTGWIIQTKWLVGSKYTPHTLIVAAAGPGGFWAIESNWDSGRIVKGLNVDPYPVNYRWVTSSDFYSRVGCYSCYVVK